MSGKLQAPRDVSAHRHGNEVVILVQFSKLFPGHRHPKLDADAGHGEEAVDLLIPDRLGEPFPRDNLGKFTADFVVLFEDMGFDPGQGQLPGKIHPGRSGADNRHPAIERCGRLRGGNLAHRPAQNLDIDRVIHSMS